MLLWMHSDSIQGRENYDAEWKKSSRVSFSSYSWTLRRRRSHLLACDKGKEHGDESSYGVQPRYCARVLTESTRSLPVLSWSRDQCVCDTGNEVGLVISGGLFRRFAFAWTTCAGVAGIDMSAQVSSASVCRVLFWRLKIFFFITRLALEFFISLQAPGTAGTANGKVFTTSTEL